MTVLMAWSGQALDIQNGLAVDCPGTTSHHQIVEADYNESTGDTTLHYSVFYAPLDFNLSITSIPKDFSDRMCCKTPETPDKKLELENYYQKFLKSIRPYNKSLAFNLDECAKALTYDLTFDDAYNFTDFSVRPTCARMLSKFDYMQANAQAFSLNPNKNLRLWHDAIAGYSGWENKKVDFGRITTCTTDIIQKRLIDKALENGLDLIYRIDPQKAYYDMSECEDVAKLSLRDRVARFSSRYGSVLKAESRKESLLRGNERTRVPSTAARNDIDFFNVASTWEFFNNFDSNRFPEGTALAIANYKRHTTTWQYLGLLKAA